MHPADQFEAFRGLHQGGIGIEDIAVGSGCRHGAAAGGTVEVVPESGTGAKLGSPWLEDEPDDGQTEAVFGGFQGESCFGGAAR